MSGRTTHVAPALLATLFACLAMTATALRAEPEAAAASSDDCLAKPGVAPAGSHWYYRLDRASGRRCWHLRAQAGQADSADAKPDQGESAATGSVAAPASSPSAAAPPDPLANAVDTGPSAGAPVAPPPRATADLPSTPAPSQPAAPMTTNAAPITGDNAEAPATRAIDPQVDAPTVESNSGSAPPIAAQVPPMVLPAPAVERPATSAIDPAHIPALLGTGLVLAFIILGSIAAHFVGRALQRRRQRRAVREAPPLSWDAADTEAAAAHLRAVPATALRVRRNEREADRPVAPRETPPGAAAGGETVQALEENVRELLQRLRSDPNGKSPRLTGVAASAPSASRPVAPAPPPVPGDLEAALAVWAGNRKRVHP